VPLPTLPVLKLTHVARKVEIVDHLVLRSDGEPGMMGTCASITARAQNLALITDDKMGEEW
jgi:hypothetical protein